MFKLNLQNYFLRHLQVMFYSLGQICRTPIISAMTVLVIAIALVLPAGLYVLLKNLEQVSQQWQVVGQISMFLHHRTTDQRGQQLAEQLLTWPDIKAVHYQSAKDSLSEFRELSGLDNLLDNLPSNPLPPVIIIQPKASQSENEALQSLLERLQNLQEVELAKLDLEWLQRLRSINETGERSISILAILLSLSVLLVIGNTIRLTIMNRKTEIRVIKLVGGTNAFVRRPFLYAGFWYGLLGGLIAWLTLLATLFFISGPVNQLAAMYDSHFTLNWLGSQMMIALPMLGLVLGVLGAWLSVGQHINEIEPN